VRVPGWFPPRWIVVLAALLGGVAIVIASAYGESARPAAWVGAIVALLILAWGVFRDS